MIHVTYEKECCNIILDNAPFNVLNIVMMKELNASLESLNEKTDIKALVIKGEGKAFSAGVDVTDHTPEKTDEMISVFHKIFFLLQRFKGVTIAAVNGLALGGGCELAMFCDIVLASDKAKLGQPEITVGVFPPVAVPIFPRLAGRNRALELLITGDVISADEAFRIGLVNHVYPAEEFERKIGEFKEKIMAKSYAVITLTKRVIDETLYLPVMDGIGHAEKIYLKELMNTEDAKEGIQAFLEKRKPVWKNR
jgi:cyclohexa-1,5-dienecarbonyl-CoA hydratase